MKKNLRYQPNCTRNMDQRVAIVQNRQPKTAEVTAVSASQIPSLNTVLNPALFASDCTQPEKPAFRFQNGNGMDLSGIL